MDIIENWNLLNSRMKNDSPELIPKLMAVHMGAFDDLRRSGDLVNVGGQKLSLTLHQMSPENRLDAAGQIGRGLIRFEMGTSLFDRTARIDLADHFPNCIFIALAAVVENLEGGLNTLLGKGQKFLLTCIYRTAAGSGDPLGALLPLLSQCYPWVQVKPDVSAVETPKTSARTIDVNTSSVLFVPERVTPVDTARLVFTGKLLRGRIAKNDALNVTDRAGHVLCPEGPVIVMFTGGKQIDVAQKGQYIDEMMLAVNLPRGTYSNDLLLVDGDGVTAKSAIQTPKTPSANGEEPPSKQGFFSRLFGKKQ